MVEQDWTRVDATVRAVLAANGGMAHASAFDEAGLSRRQLAAVFRCGVLARPRIGWYVDPDLPWQVKRAVRVGGIACCITAAALWGLPVPPDAHQVLHVLVQAHEGRLRHNRDRSWVLPSVEDDQEVHLHRRNLHDEPISGRTSVIDTVLALAGCVPSAWWIAALDAAPHVPRGGAPLLDAQEWLRLLTLLPRRRRRDAGRADPLSESPLETLLRLALLDAGIAVVCQAVLHPSCRVDLLVGARLVVEVDGAAFHDVAKDRVRDELLRSLGCTVLRFGYERIVNDIDAVVAEIEGVLATLRQEGLIPR